MSGEGRGVWLRRPAVVLLVLALAAGATACDRSPETKRSSGSGTSSSAAPSPTTDDREQELADLLRTRAEAVLAHDRAAFAATLADPANGFGLRQLAQFDALAKLPLAEFSYASPEPAPALSETRAAQLGPDAWVARVSGSYRLDGYDARARSFESYFSVIHRGGQWLLADDTDGGTQPQLWNLPSFTVVKGRASLVVGTGPVSRLRPYAALADRAVSRVTAVWGRDWNRRLVVVVPRNGAGMAELVGQEAGSVDQVAAVTDGPFDTDGRAGADRVVVNPTAFSTLEERGKQVVVTHEATHVAIRATTTRPVPLWLSEGMADYIGYRDVSASTEAVASALLAKVRAGKGPKSLPDAAAFDPSRTTIGPNYNAAWLAVRLIAERWGTPTLARFYREAATAPAGSTGGDPSDAEVEAATAQAFASVLHTSVRAFTKDWLAYLRRLAHA